MKIIEWLRELVGITVIEEYDDDSQNEIIEAPANDISSKMLKRVPPEERSNRTFGQAFDLTKPDNNIVSGLKIEIFLPQAIDDCPIIADKLKAGHPVIANFEYTKTDVAGQIYYFLKGCCYALGGTNHMIGKNIFLFSPKIIEVSEIGTKASLDNTFSFSWKLEKNPK